jgi:hypothetical protein
LLEIAPIIIGDGPHKNGITGFGWQLRNVVHGTLHRWPPATGTEILKEVVRTRAQASSLGVRPLRILRIAERAEDLGKVPDPI